MERDGGEGRGESHVGEFLQLGLGTDVDLGFEEGEWLEELFLHPGLDDLGMFTMNDSRPCVLVNISTIILVSPYLMEWRTMA